MYFKKLELLGFKSFADKTEIVFEPGVTAIVGPNGCGKSNISDAIRWVLGEQSAKSLRGGSMEDVIFNGSSSKEALSLAEVSLTLSNEQRILAIDYDEVTITRRLYRSGESEYLLNKNVVRLRDINELLMGTGIGTEGYSIIEQGKMDQILNAKPDQRREIFEEAAGITKFKSKKKEALRKLEQTEQNLLRVNDIIQEVKRQIGSMERQAKKAEQYKLEFEKLKTLEIRTASKEFLGYEAKRKFAEENLEALKEEIRQAEEAVSEIGSAWQTKKEGMHGLEQEERQSQSRIFEIDSQIRQSQDRLLLNRERVGELMERRENTVRLIDQAKARLVELASEFERLDMQFQLSQNENGLGGGGLDEAQADFDQFQAEMISNQEDLIEQRARLSDNGDERQRAQTELSRVAAQSAGLGGKLKRVKTEEETLLAEIRELIESHSLPLFEQQGEMATKTPPGRLAERLGQFKSKIAEIYRSVFSRGASEPSAEESQSIDAEIQTFTDDVVGLHAQALEFQGRQKAALEAKAKLEAKLAVISEEISAILGEQNTLNEIEKAATETLNLLDSQEKAGETEIARLEQVLSDKAVIKEEKLVRLTQLKLAQETRNASKEQIEKDRNWVLSSKGSQENQIAAWEKEIEESGAKKEQLESENGALERVASEAAQARDEALRASEGLRRDLEEAEMELREFETQKKEKEEFLKSCQDRAHHIELENAQTGFEINRLKDRIFNAYQLEMTLEVVSQNLEGQEDFDLETARAEIQAQRDKIQKLGPVNLAAMQEYDEMKERFNFLTQQEKDLVQAKEDLHKAILQINRTTKELFAETFEKVQTYFSEYYKLLFRGGQAELVLLDAQNILESGIEIIARPPGKKPQTITLLSGGEKALTATALMFALFKVKPSPFCILDELDAPLDETNVERFCNVLREFIKESQFILITHNKRTMNLADAMYGITMQQTGVSRVVSVKFSDKFEKKEVADKNPEEVLV